MRFEKVRGPERPRLLTRPTRFPPEEPKPKPRRRAEPEEPKPALPAARPERPRMRPESYFFVSLLFSVVVLAFFVVSDRGFLKVRRQRQQLAAVQTDVSRLDAENRALEAEVASLRKDPKAVERIARERLGLAKPGEIVVVLPDGWQARVKPAPTPAPVTPR